MLCRDAEKDECVDASSALNSCRMEFPFEWANLQAQALPPEMKTEQKYQLCQQVAYSQKMTLVVASIAMAISVATFFFAILMEGIRNSLCADNANLIQAKHMSTARKIPI